MTIDCRTCQNSRLDNFRCVRYCTKSGDYCHGERVSDGTQKDMEQFNRFVPDSGNCPGMVPIVGIGGFGCDSIN